MLKCLHRCFQNLFTKQMSLSETQVFSISCSLITCFLKSIAASSAVKMMSEEPFNFTEIICIILMYASII